ncbi:uncharacterized protein BYT42DRAFT_618687 [Radiomyces spectabilis]|uniref:uncharacterized protein n=1 Tax=Radiomyces spectabilis TaxID=64574 RepID=UPI0022203807|nr:uncharacterized protein BYT42DRAFT_618687 [Radiomyces spectabilis]KAI8365307.1 hypothetical protein BYT42DRAFT_618687 [Radiomyces spectabilis]
MKATFFVALAAVFVATVSAAGHRSGVDQETNGVGNEGRVSGILNNLLKGGLLADSSKGYGVRQDAF